MEKISKDKIKVGIVGTGLMGSAHTKALRWNGINVAGILGSTYEKSKLAAASLEIPRAYQTFEEMVADNEIHVIHLTTPNHLHYPHAKAALDAGKHVVCEKPLAMNSIESRELVELGKRHQLVTAVNYNFRMTPMLQKAREICQKGDLGKPRLIHGSYLQDWLLYPTDWNWRLDPALAGQLRTVGDIGSHWLDLASYISGLRIQEVFADFSTFVNKRTRGQDSSGLNEISIDTEDYAAVLIHFENGVQGVMYISQMSPGHKNRLLMEINGSESSIAWNAEESGQLWIGNRDKDNFVLEEQSVSTSSKEVPPVVKKQTSANTFNELYRRIYAYIVQGDYLKKPDFPTFEDGHYGMLVMEAIQKSAQSKTWVTVPLD